eukprot:gene2858-3122_t
MINFILLVSRQGKTRLTKWFVQMNAKEKARAVRELTATVLARPPKMCNFIEWQDKKVIYKRYASLFFIACVDKDDNELIVLEQIHLFVEVLDRYFGNVCELDIIFNFHKAYYILDELFIGGHLQETSKAEVLRICAAMDEMMDESKEDGATPGRPNTKGNNAR